MCFCWQSSLGWDLSDSKAFRISGDHPPLFWDHLELLGRQDFQGVDKCNNSKIKEERLVLALEAVVL